MRHFLWKVIGLILILYIADLITMLALAKIRPELVVTEMEGRKVLTWTKTLGPVYYEVESVVTAGTEGRFIKRLRTFKNTLTVDAALTHKTYWRVITMRLSQRPLGFYSNWVNTNDYSTGAQDNVIASTKPSPIEKVSGNVGSKYPLLFWTPIEGAVYYELEFLDRIPENLSGIEPSPISIWSTRDVFKNGYIADLTWVNTDVLYWRVRGLDVYGLPLGVFSDVQQIFIQDTEQQPLKPFLTVTFNENGRTTPLYPVYAWIPIPGVFRYEVEVCNQPPENPNGIEPSRYRIWQGEGRGYDLYDEIPRNKAGTYYWRVRGLDEDGNAAGVYSDAGKFEVTLSEAVYSACFGDSITHGGGAISYSPSDWEYDFETYLNFPTINLGRSGDTADTMVGRFNTDVLPFRPRYLIILGGTNSIRGGTTGFEVVRELTQLRNMCEKQGIRPIFLTLPPINPDAIGRVFGEETSPYWREELDIVNHFVRQQKFYIDIEPFLSDGNGLLPERFAIDGLHPDIEGKKIIAAVINQNWFRVTR